MKFEEAVNRLFKNIFVCKKCGSKVRVPALKVSREEAVCRKCRKKTLRPKRKK